MIDEGELLHRVCAWLDEHLIVDYIGTPSAAANFENALRRSFATLRITNEDADSVDYASGPSRLSADR
jgi:hypothetical protein